MTPDAALAWAQVLAQTIDPPWGPRLVKILGSFRSSMPRIMADIPVIQNFLDELLPLIQKHITFFRDLGLLVAKYWRPLLASTNDLIPIAEQIIAESKE